VAAAWRSGNDAKCAGWELCVQNSNSPARIIGARFLVTIGNGNHLEAVSAYIEEIAALTTSL